MSIVKLTLEIDGDKQTFDMSESETVLEAALRQGIDAPYSCMAGVCTACQAEVVSGNVEMENNDILSDDEVAEGQVLCCTAKAKSSEIHVKYPE